MPKHVADPFNSNSFLESSLHLSRPHSYIEHSSPVLGNRSVNVVAVPSTFAKHLPMSLSHHLLHQGRYLSLRNKICIIFWSTKIVTGTIVALPDTVEEIDISTFFLICVDLSTYEFVNYTKSPQLKLRLWQLLWIVNFSYLISLSEHYFKQTVVLEPFNNIFHITNNYPYQYRMFYLPYEYMI